MSEIMVYFNSGNRARLPKNVTSFAVIHGQTDETFAPDTEGGKVVVNWDNVSFVREWQEPEDEDDEH